MYSWDSVSTRTEKVYRKCMETPKSTFEDRICRYYGCGGPLSRVLVITIIAMCTAFLKIVEWMEPEAGIETPTEWSEYARSGKDTKKYEVELNKD